MSAEPQPQESNILEVDLKPKSNNFLHNTNEVTTEKLIVRRGQHFVIGLKFKDPYIPDIHILTFTASTESAPNENEGTKSVFGIPDNVKRSAEAKAVWKAQCSQEVSTDVDITITPPADAPVGKYSLSLNYSGEDKELGTLVLLFNAWCPDDSVYMDKKNKRQEFVMNETGAIYRGSGNYIKPLVWDFGQFEDDMVDIVIDLLNNSHNYREDSAKDEAARCDPVYVGRVISAMINSAGEIINDRGVLEGNWSGHYSDGTHPCHWNGSHPILKCWRDNKYKPVKYGQCWVFAGVMCSVMRALGVPCRVVTNFDSAHDCHKNLLIDEYHADYGVKDIPDNVDSVWNFHVWVEAWMKRPDLPQGNDGWQVLDPTPQELSGGVFCCGPTSVKSILNGHVDLKYDCPFVFSEVNADCVDWLVKADGSHKILNSDTKRVGQNISTKYIGNDPENRKDITSRYKHKEGSKKERRVFRYAMTRDFCKPGGEVDSEESEDEEEETEGDEEPAAELPKVSLRFEEVSEMVSGQDVKLNLVLHSEATEPRPLSINICVKAKSYTGSAHSNIQSERKEDTLLPKQDLCVPVVVSFSKYWKPMLDNDVMKISAVVSDTGDDSETYLAQCDVVLQDPPIEVKVLNDACVFRPLYLEVCFKNPVFETLKDCTLTLSGSGLWRDEQDISLPDLGPNRRVRARLCFLPYKCGRKTLVADFNCSVFRDIKKSLPIHVK